MADAPTILEVRPGETETVTIDNHVVDADGKTVKAYVISGAGTSTLVGSATGAAPSVAFDITCTWPDVNDAVYLYEVLVDAGTPNERNILGGTWIVRLEDGWAG